jgi:rubrerythrin
MHITNNTLISKDFVTAQTLENVKKLDTLDERELTRALRDAIVAEEIAINQYEAIADSTGNKDAKKVLQHIADEERVHVGELQKLLSLLLPDEQKLLDEGAKEVEEEIKDEDEEATIEIED